MLPQLVEPGLPRGGLPPRQGRADERAHAGPARQQRRGARQGAPPARHLRRHAVRPPGARHASPGIDAITLDDVQDFAKTAYTRGEPDDRRRGRRPGRSSRPGSRPTLAKLPAGPALAAPAGVAGRKPSGIEVEIIEKETRATAISFGFPIDVTRSHPDFAALSVARVVARRAPLVQRPISTSASARCAA